MNASSITMDHDQSGTDPISANPAFIEDIKQRVATNITKVILEQDDLENDIEPQRQVPQAQRVCHRCFRKLDSTEFHRRGSDQWAGCNHCAATRKRAAERRKARLHAGFRKWQPLVDSICSRQLPSSQDQRSSSIPSGVGGTLPSRAPSPKIGTVEHFRSEQLNLDPRLRAQISSAKLPCAICHVDVPLCAFIRKGRLWKSCNTCGVKVQVRRAAMQGKRKKTCNNRLHSNAATSTATLGAGVESYRVALSREIVGRFSSCDWRSVNLLNYAALPPSAPALHHALIDYTLSIRLLEVVDRWSPPHAQHTSSRDDFVLEVFLLLKELKNGRIQPWSPLATWFDLFKDEWNVIKSNVHPSYSFQQFISRTPVLQDKLAEIARMQLDQAKEDIEILLEGELACEHWYEELEKFLGRVKQQVQDDCRAFGCLNLREIFSAQDINNAQFSKFWTLDGLDFV